MAFKRKYLSRSTALSLAKVSRSKNTNLSTCIILANTTTFGTPLSTSEPSFSKIATLHHTKSYCTPLIKFNIISNRYYAISFHNAEYAPSTFLIFYNYFIISFSVILNKTYIFLIFLGPQHTREKFCIQAHSFKLLKDLDMKHCFFINYFQFLKCYRSS